MRWLKMWFVAVLVSTLWPAAANEESPTIVVLPDGIHLQLESNATTVTSRVVGPEEPLLTEGTLAKSASGVVADGHYRYQVDMLPVTRTRTAKEFEANQYAKAPLVGKRLSGAFSVSGGQLVDASTTEEQADNRPMRIPAIDETRRGEVQQ